MAKIILDLDGVVFEPIKELVIKAAFKKYGYFRASAMLVKFCSHAYRSEIIYKMSDLIRECRENAKFLPGADTAIEYLVGLHDCSVNVCSTMPFESDAVELEKFYRSRAKCMNKIERYELLGLDNPKINFYRGAKPVFDHMYVLDDSMHNIRSAYMVNASPVFISANRGAIKRARQKYAAMNFASLAEFADFIRVNKR